MIMFTMVYDTYSSLQFRQPTNSIYDFDDTESTHRWDMKLWAVVWITFIFDLHSNVLLFIRNYFDHIASMFMRFPRDSSTLDEY